MLWSHIIGIHNQHQARISVVQVRSQQRPELADKFPILARGEDMPHPHLFEGSHLVEIWVAAKIKVPAQFLPVLINERCRLSDKRINWFNLKRG